jgi:hypothetical protein
MSEYDMIQQKVMERIACKKTVTEAMIKKVLKEVLTEMEVSKILLKNINKN